MSHFVNEYGYIIPSRIFGAHRAASMKYHVFHSPNNCHYLEPEYAVLHYTAGGSLLSAANCFSCADSKVSAHFIIDRAGDLAQCVALDKCAWHCGKSEWKGKKDMNFHSIGIELVNWGPLQRDQDTGLFHPLSAHGTRATIPPQEVYDCSLSDPENDLRYWQSYTAQQLFTLCSLLHALFQEYQLEEVLRHSDIAPGRKIDPGPALPYEQIQICTKPNIKRPPLI